MLIAGSQVPWKSVLKELPNNSYNGLQKNYAFYREIENVPKTYIFNRKSKNDGSKFNEVMIQFSTGVPEEASFWTEKWMICECCEFI